MVQVNRIMAWLEIRIHMIDAYLAECRGDKVEAADCYLRAQRVKREIELREICN